MKKWLHQCSLSLRMAVLLTGLGLCAAIFLCVLWRSEGELGVPLAAGLFAVLFGSVTALAAGVLLPLYRAEALLLRLHGGGAELAHFAEETSLQAHPMGRALLILEQEICARYTGDLLSKQATLDMLQSQINPHFLYNTLDSIRGQALQEGATDIADMTEALSTFFRYSISNRARDVSLEEELENVRNYFKIQQFRFNNRFQLSILPTERCNLEQCRLPKLTLQPILENTILHGMEGKLGAGTIKIRIEGTENLIFITVSDDGTGMSEETLLRLQARLRGETVESDAEGTGKRRGTGMALPNIVRRIHLLFGEQYGMQVMSTLGAGTDVRITLPRVLREAAAHEA